MTTICVIPTEEGYSIASDGKLSINTLNTVNDVDKVFVGKNWFIAACGPLSALTLAEEIIERYKNVNHKDLYLLGQVILDAAKKSGFEGKVWNMIIGKAITANDKVSHYTYIVTPTLGVMRQPDERQAVSIGTGAGTINSIVASLEISEDEFNNLIPEERLIDVAKSAIRADNASGGFQLRKIEAESVESVDISNTGVDTDEHLLGVLKSHPNSSLFYGKID